MSRAAFQSMFLAVSGLLCLEGGAALGAIDNGNLVTIGRWQNNNTASDASTGEYLDSDPTYGGSLSGGEFRITEVDGGEVFKTFCLEYNEFIAIHGTQYVATVNDGAILGGLSGGGSANGYYDPISVVATASKAHPGLMPVWIKAAATQTRRPNESFWPC